LKKTGSSDLLLIGVRHTEVIAEARKMPLGERRCAALREAGRLRIAAEMNRWLANK
jgi:hypothetical protein